MIVRDPAGVQVLELGDEDFVGGYLVVDFDDGKRSFKRVTTEAPRVDGATDVAVSLRRALLRLVVHVTGASVAEVRARRDALLAAVEVPWVLDVDGSVAWSCAVADSDTARLGDATLDRQVTLSIPAQPSTYGF